jgi:hypothetical protein
VEEHAVVLGAPHRGPQVHHRRQHSCPAEPNRYVPAISDTVPKSL